jgi:hypothetical protein
MRSLMVLVRLVWTHWLYKEKAAMLPHGFQGPLAVPKREEPPVTLKLYDTDCTCVHKLYVFVGSALGACHLAQPLLLVPI